jgi:hypothetical protein
MSHLLEHLILIDIIEGPSRLFVVGSFYYGRCPVAPLPLEYDGDDFQVPLMSVSREPRTERGRQVLLAGAGVLVVCSILVALLLLQPADVGGCYVLHVGEYAPDVGADRQFFLPPDTIELTTIPSEKSPQTFNATPGLMPNALPGVWRMRGDTVQMTWSDGTTGVHINAFVRNDSLTGTAWPVSDIVVPDNMRSKALVSGARTAC